MHMRSPYEVKDQLIYNNSAICSDDSTEMIYTAIAFLSHDTESLSCGGRFVIGNKAKAISSLIILLQKSECGGECCMSGTWEKYQIVATTEHSIDAAAATLLQPIRAEPRRRQSLPADHPPTRLVIPSELWPNYDDWMPPLTTPRRLCPPPPCSEMGPKRARLAGQPVGARSNPLCPIDRLRHQPASQPASGPWFGGVRPTDRRTDGRTPDAKFRRAEKHKYMRVTVTADWHYDTYTLHSGAVCWPPWWPAASRVISTSWVSSKSFLLSFIHEKLCYCR